MTDDTNPGPTTAEQASTEQATTDLAGTDLASTDLAGAGDTTSGPQPAPDAGSREGRGYTVCSLIMAVLALLAIPPLHGIIGAVLGYVGYRKGDSLGTTAMACSLVAMVVGSVLAALLYGSVT